MNKRIFVIAFAAFIFPFSAAAQLFQPLGIGFQGGERQGPYSQPRMHVEGDKLYVCTAKGLYVRDLTDDGSDWLSAGFEGIPLQDYVRRGDDMLALRYNEGGTFLLLSHDSGQTYEDVTPDVFRLRDHEHLPSLAQHPTDPSILLLSSMFKGVFRSTDFGQTWERLTYVFYGNGSASFVGFHPAQPSILYHCGEGGFFEPHFYVSYDDGQKWVNHSDDLMFPGDNCVHRPSFHPTQSERWLVGGEGCVYLSDDNGQTWTCQNYLDDKARSAYWYFSAFDTERPETVYLAGDVYTSFSNRIRLMCSTDGGRSWLPSQEMTTEERTLVNDLQQYHDRLIVYAESGVYTVAKADLIEQSTNSVHTMTADGGPTATFDLQGRRLAEPRRSIYLKNHRKYLKK